MKVIKRKVDVSIAYEWHEMTFFSQWERGKSMVLCIGTPALIQQSLQAVLPGHQFACGSNDSYAMLVPLVDAIISLYDHAIWSVRDTIRIYEKVCVVKIPDSQ